MKKHEKYLEALKTFDDYVTIREWAEKFIELYPDDFKIIDEQAKSQKTKTTGLRELQKQIFTNIKNSKIWTEILSIDDTLKIKKVKYINEEDRKEKVLSRKVNDIKFTNFQVLMEELRYLLDDEDLPSRNQYSRFENNGHFSGYKGYIAFEMAIRNKNVIDITQKLDYIKDIIDHCQSLMPFRDWLLGIVYWEDKFEGEDPELVIDSETKKEYISITELPTIEFKNEIDFLTNTKELTNNKSKSVLRLKTIADYLQDKLTKEYHIYKDGYYFINDNGYFDSEEALDLDSIHKHDFNTFKVTDEIKLSIDKFINRKTDNMRQTADMFFMYDYYIKKKDNNNLAFCTQDLKFELTKYHGVKIKGFSEMVSYDECVSKYENFKDSEAGFYEVERTITDKIKLIEKFINEKLYRFILFY